MKHIRVPLTEAIFVSQFHGRRMIVSHRQDVEKKERVSRSHFFFRIQSSAWRSHSLLSTKIKNENACRVRCRRRTWKKKCHQNLLNVKDVEINEATVNTNFPWMFINISPSNPLSLARRHFRLNKIFVFRLLRRILFMISTRSLPSPNYFLFASDAIEWRESKSVSGERFFRNFVCWSDLIPIWT